MRTRILLSLATLCLLGLTSCVDSKNPITGIEDAKVDDRLVGAWISTDGNETLYVQIGFEATKALTPGAGKPEPALMRFSASSLMKEGDRTVNGGVGSARFYVSKLGDESFINMVQPFEEIPASQAPDKSDGYLLMKYKFDEGQLKILFFDRDVLAKAIKDGELDGTITKNKFISDLKLTGSSAQLAAYFASPAGKKAFSNEPIWKLRPLREAP